MSVAEWFLGRAERGNPHTRVDERHADGSAWSGGNRVRPLIHGDAYFAEVLRVVEGTRAGDLVLFTDWRGDADERLAGPGTEVARVLAAAARRTREGVDVALAQRLAALQREGQPTTGRAAA